MSYSRSSCDPFRRKRFMTTSTLVGQLNALMRDHYPSYQPHFVATFCTDHRNPPLLFNTGGLTVGNGIAVEVGFGSVGGSIGGANVGVGPGVIVGYARWFTGKYRKYSSSPFTSSAKAQTSTKIVSNIHTTCPLVIVAPSL